MLLKTSKFSERVYRIVATILVAAFCLSGFAVSAYGAGSSIDVYYMGATGNPVGSYFEGSLNNGAYVATFYVDGSMIGGKTLVNKMPMSDVYVAKQLVEADYYYAFGATTVDAYYVGESDKPTGSYLPGSQIDGAFVDTYADTTGWDQLGVDGRIAIPSLTEGVNPIEHSLTVAAQENELATVIYSNTFRWDFMLDATFDDAAVALIANNSDEPLAGNAILAAYNSRGALAYTEVTTVEVAANTAFKLTFDVNLSDYPAGEYSYAVFYWDTNYAPVFPAVRN